MTQGDIQELITLVALFGGGLSISDPLIRKRFLLTLLAMTSNMVAGRCFIAYFHDAYIYATAFQISLATFVISLSPTRSGIAIGLLYAGMVIGGGATALGYLSPETGVGLSLSYWSCMSVLTYLQFVTMAMIWAWHYSGLGIGRGID